MPAEKKKAQKALPSKPSTFSDEQWALAHSAAKLLELLAAPERAAHSASSKTGEKPLASKQSAALWLFQLLGSSPDASEEAFKAGAVDACAKLINTHSSDHATLASLLGVLAHMASIPAGPTTLQVREAIMTVRPAVVPALLSQLEQFCAVTTNSSIPVGTSHHSTSSVAAALRLLSVLASSPDTRLRVTKLMAGWNMSPLVAVLLAQKGLPLEGGRHASSDAAAVLETVCAPAAAPAPADASSGSGNGGKKGKKDADASKGKNSAASPVGEPVDPSLTAAVQQGVLAAEGISALVKLCAAVGAPAAARVSAAAALQHLMTAHGKEEHVKLEFLAAGGLPTMLKLTVSSTLALPARGAAAGCIWHYLAPKPGDTAAAAAVTAGTTTAPSPSTAAAVKGSSSSSTGFFLDLTPAAGQPAAAAATTAVAAANPRGALMRPVTSQEARSNLIAAARTLRKQQLLAAEKQQQLQQAQPDAATSVKPSSDGGRSAGSSVSGGSVRTSVVSGEATSLIGTSVPETEDQSTTPAATAAAYEASLAVWDAAAQAGLAARVDQVIQSGCVPALLLLCCGPEGPPTHLLAAAQAAAASAQVSTVGADTLDLVAPVGGNAAVTGPELASATSLMSSLGQRAGASASLVSASRGLGAIVEPSHGEEGTEGEESEGEAAEPSADGVSSSAGAAGGGIRRKKEKKGKKKKKSNAKVDPAVEIAQCHASAAVNLLALSGDAGRGALQNAGAKAVLLPLLAATAAQARWNARQALMALRLTSSSSNKAGATSAAQRRMSECYTAEKAAGNQSRPSSGPPWQFGTEPVKIPDYIAMSNLPASHYQRSVPISQVPLPVLPSIPGKQRAMDGSNSSNTTCAAGGVGGSTAAGSVRPNSTARRTSMSNLAGTVTAAGRLSSGSFYGSNMAVGDGQGSGAEISSAGTSRVSVIKGPRTSMLAAATGAGSGPAATPTAGGA